MFRATTAPPDGAADARVTVQVVEPPTAKVEGLQLRLDTGGPLLPPPIALAPPTAVIANPVPVGSAPSVPLNVTASDVTPGCKIKVTEATRPLVMMFPFIPLATHEYEFKSGMQAIDLPAEVADGPGVTLADQISVEENPNAHCTAAGSEPAGEFSAILKVRLPEELVPDDKVRVSDCP